MATVRIMKALLLLFLFSNGLAGQSLEAQIDAYVRPFVDSRDFSGTILIAKDERILFQKAYGMANFSLNVGNQTNTKFGIGSISKQFTAAAILDLVDDGKVKLDEKLDKYLPELGFAERVTIHHLLTHTSGIKNNLFDNPEELKRFRTLDEIAMLLKDDELLFEPGSSLQYSNPGYCLLALIVERASGMNYETYIDNMLNSKGISAIQHNDNVLPIRNMANGYDPANNEMSLRQMVSVDYSNIKGAGSLFASVNALHNWNQILHQGRLLSDSSYMKMTTNHSGGRGYGLGIYKRSGERVFGHDGVFHGFHGFLEWYPDQELTITYLGNIRSGFLSQLQGALSAIYFGKETEDFSYQKASGQREVDESYVGRYELFPGFNLYVDQWNGELRLRGDGGYYTDLTPVDGGYFYRAMFAKIVFSEKENRPTLTWIDRRGNEYDAIKKDPR